MRENINLYFNYFTEHAMLNTSNDNRDGHHGFIDIVRPRSSCEMPRVPGIQYVF